MDLAALLMAALLGIGQWIGLGLLGPAETPENAIKAITGFSQPVVITLISLFTLTHGLEKSGVTQWIARQIVRMGGRDDALDYSVCTGDGAAFPGDEQPGGRRAGTASRHGRCAQSRYPPSKLLIPVAFGSLLGGSATYFTTANIIMSDLLRITNPPQNPLRFLDFLPTGGLIAVAGIAFLALGRKKTAADREIGSG